MTKIQPIKIRYGITKKVKGKYFDLALYHIKYVYSIEYPGIFNAPQPGGKNTQGKVNNIKIFKRLRAVYKLKFDPKSQWLSKSGYIHTVKSSLQCCEKFQYIGLNIIRDMKRLKEFEYNFPYRLSFDLNKIKDINYLKFTKDLQRLSVYIDSFDNKNMYKKLFEILKKKKKLEVAKFTKINISLAKPHFDTLFKLQHVSIMNAIQIEHLINLKSCRDELKKLAIFTAPKCLLLLENMDYYKNLKHLELNDFILSSDFDEAKHFKSLRSLEALAQLESLILELNFTQKAQTNMFFRNLKLPVSVKRLDFTLLNIFFSSEDSELLEKDIRDFFQKSDLKDLQNLKLALTICENFTFINQFIKLLPMTLTSLENVDFLFRTENEFDEAVNLDSFLIWTNNLKSVKEITFRTTNFVVKGRGDIESFDFPKLEYLRLSEEFGRKNSLQSQRDGGSKQIIECLHFLKNNTKRLFQTELVLNLTDLIDNFPEMIFGLLDNLPRNLKALRLKIIHKKEEKLNLDQEVFSSEVQRRVQGLEELKVLELNMPVYFRFGLENINKYQRVIIPGIWKEKPSGIIYYW